MQIVYTDRHKRHATDGVWFEDHPFVTEEVPARGEIILGAVQAAQLGPVVTPTDHGLALDKGQRPQTLPNVPNRVFWAGEPALSEAEGMTI